ncbi:hypothetical protein Taro_001837 [Colocasia esculenta]|uniref:C2H2-type domain-containing protein n=1 Tax=Colocasia esculenta TaxID=4460 RepID=A0A843TJ94_COLES|nr:hypothetical protein [Colocasia esculenta]
MEQSRYLMWTKRKPVGKPHLPTFASGASAAASYGYSWEEQAFAEDSAGRFGGCVWPPRSYSCSFCRREFKSAQALGGHMNVHRRDRARLKMSTTSHVESSDHLHQQPLHQHLSNPCPPLAAAQHPSSPQVCTAVHYSSRNPRATHGVAASPPSSPRVSMASLKNSSEQPSLVSASSASSWVKEDRKGCLFSISLGHPELKLGRESMQLEEMGCGEERDADRKDEEEAISRKRRRIDVATPFAVRSSLSDGDGSALQSERERKTEREGERVKQGSELVLHGSLRAEEAVRVCVAFAPKLAD